MILIERPFKTARERNQKFIDIENALSLCCSLEDLKTFMEEYKRDIENLKKHDELSNSDTGPIYDFLARLIENQENQIKEKENDYTR